MKKFSNTYIFLYISGLVLVVAVLLSLVSIKLKPLQTRNQELEQRQQILKAAGYTEMPKRQISRWYDKHIQEMTLASKDGQQLPLYVLKDNKTIYIIPVQGKGLWGPIGGYVALDSDGNIVVGAAFSHKSETPGLGAEITTEKFQSQFKGKTIFDEEQQFVSVAVAKGGAERNNLNPEHTVDAISGATITSKGVDAMLRKSLQPYAEALHHIK